MWAGLDVSDDLMGVLAKEGKVTFLQLYVDSPHAYVNMPFKHPVSGAIVHQFLIISFNLYSLLLLLPVTCVSLLFTH